MRTTVEPLEGNRVKVSVEVDETEFDRALDAAFRRLAREVRIPGFRPGKAPRPILEARLGTEAAREEALREALPEYYAEAVRSNDIDVIAAPEIDITAGRDGGHIAFDAVVEVRPRIVVPGYASLRVEIPSPIVTDDDVAARIDALRAQSGTLSDVDRPAATGDFVTIDVAGSSDGEPVPGLVADDFSYEVGSGRVLPEFDEHLAGAKVGDILLFDAAMPGRDEPVQIRILVKSVAERVLPDADDEWAAENSEFDTLAELQEDLRRRLDVVKRATSAMALSDAIGRALVELVDEEPPDTLVLDEVRHRLQDLELRLQAQGASLAGYLEATGNSQEDLVNRLREEAARSVVLDLALRAVAEAEGLEATDDEIDAEIAAMAERLGRKPNALRREVQRSGTMTGIASEVRKRKALEWLVDHAEVVDEAGVPVDRDVLLGRTAPDAEGSAGDPHDHAEAAEAEPAPEEHQ